MEKKKILPQHCTIQEAKLKVTMWVRVSSEKFSTWPRNFKKDTIIKSDYYFIWIWEVTWSNNFSTLKSFNKIKKSHFQKSLIFGNLARFWEICWAENFSTFIYLYRSWLKIILFLYTFYKPLKDLLKYNNCNSCL